MDSYKPYAGPGSSNQPPITDEANNNQQFHTPRQSTPTSRNTSASPLSFSERDTPLPYPLHLVSNSASTQRPSSPLAPRTSSMLPPLPQTTSPALSRQSSQRNNRARSSTVTSDDGRSMFMSEFRKQSGSGLRPDMKAMCPDQVGTDQVISDDEGPLATMPGAMPAGSPAQIPRSEPMERQSSSKRSSKIFTRGRTPSDTSIAGDDSESGFRAKVSKLLKSKDSKPDLIANILADEAANGNAFAYEEHMRMKSSQGVTTKYDIESQASTQVAAQYYSSSVPIPPAGTQLDGYAAWDAMIQKQQDYASDLEAGETKKSRRKSKKSRSPSPAMGDPGIDRLMLSDDLVDPLTLMPSAATRQYRSKSQSKSQPKTHKKSPTMSPVMLPTIPQSKTVPYPSHLARHASPPVDIFELAAMERPSHDRRRKTKQQAKRGGAEIGSIFRKLYESTPSFDVLVQVVLQPIETARKSAYPNLAIVIAMVELLIFIWLLYQAIIILEFACAVIRFICYPAIYILKAVASSFPEMGRV